MIKLTLTEKGGQPRALTFDQDEVSIGRVQGNDIVLPKGNISKRHSKLTQTDGRIMVADSKSTNGTYVNGRKISEPTSVRTGDKIFVGDFLIVIDPVSTAETSSTGSRRAAPPPPPPPPRPGVAARSPLESSEEIDAGGSLGDHADRGPQLGRGRPPAPPPPPPRRTMVTSALEDDSVDMGADDAPPSPAEVEAEAEASVDPAAGLASDVEDDALAGTGDDLGRNVFGSHAASDEDAGPDAGLDAASADAKAADAEAEAPASPPTSTDDAEELPPTPGPARLPHLGATEVPVPPLTLESLLGDPSVTAILIGSGGGAQVERGGALESIATIGDGNVVAETVWQLANTALPPPAADNPVVDVRLGDGTRVTAMFPPITSASVCAVIRKASLPEATLSELAGGGDLEKIVAAAVAARRNLLVAGDGAALTAMAGAVGKAIAVDRRVVSVGLGSTSRAGWTELVAVGDPSALIRGAVAFRADYLLVGESGGGELAEVLLAAARGQTGVMACIAARSAAEALERLRAFTIAAVGPAAFTSFVGSTIDLIVLVESTPGGSARVVEIAEPVIDAGNIRLASVARRPDGDRTAGATEIAGVSERLAGAIAAHTESLPSHLVRR